MVTTAEARKANTVHIPGAVEPVVYYMASRRFIHANTDEDYANAYWAGPERGTRDAATADLVAHMMGEAAQVVKMFPNPTENMVDRALELAQLAGAIGTTGGNDTNLEQVTSSIGVTYAIRRLHKP
jgi:hypothetical protein